MKYALKLAEDSRILSATYEQFATENMVLVDSLPEGDIYNYLYKDGEYIYEPLAEQHGEPFLTQPTTNDN